MGLVKNEQQNNMILGTYIFGIPVWFILAAILFVFFFVSGTAHKKKALKKLGFIQHSQSFVSGLIVSVHFLRNEAKRLKDSIEIDTDQETKTKKIHCSNALIARAFLLEIVIDAIKEEVTKCVAPDYEGPLCFDIDKVISKAQESVDGSQEK